ncbi:uncharacterized protein LOC121866469 [Homarus americanus]|uniref:Zinc finger CCCH domain-containing protein 10-like n=1 Tax=Homarus americanus TaxID=6706 RepID=A0A8J5MZA8_HOMAM|nr:uncharacterized protein LOC121866469 [Homarus americanus]KAG7168994.1 Zinc finger CCCH domain-containing protein 10-like [Homarus americanus]
MATKQSPKGEEQKKVPVTAPVVNTEKEPLKVEKDCKKEDKSPSKGGKESQKDAKDPKKAGKDVKKVDTNQKNDRSRQRENSRSRDRGRHGRDDKSGHRGQEREVCRNFLHNRCDRGILCKFYHPRSSSRSRSGPDDRKRSPVRAPGEESADRVVCRDFIRNMCRRGDECRFYHPPSEPGSKKQRSSWLTFCYDFQNGHCSRSDCRFFHITKEDEETFRATGEIVPQVVDQAVRKALVLDVALTGTRPTCKEFLKGICNMQNCRFRHLSQREYEDEVFHALQDELEFVLGHPERRPSSPSRNIYSSMSTYHEPPKYGTPPVDFRDDLLAPDDLRTTLLSHSDFEPEAKRPRYFGDDPMFTPRDDYGDNQRRWDDRMDYDRERLDFNSNDSERMLQEIYNLRNDNIDLRRNLEQKIADLRDELNNVMQENVSLQHENSKLRTTANEDALNHKATLEKLTVANNNLTQDSRKTQEVVRRLELENSDIRKALEVKQKSSNAQLEKKLEALEKEVIQVRESLTKANATLKKTQEEKGQLENELQEFKKMRDHPANQRKDAHHNNAPGFNQRNDYPRDSMGKGRPEAGPPEVLYGNRRDQDMRGLKARGSDRYGSDAWESDNRGQYNQGYARRGPDPLVPDIRGPDARGPDIRGPDARGPDMRGPDARGPDMRGPDARGPDMRGPDARGPDMRGPDARGPDIRGPDARGPDMRGPDARGPDIRGLDTRGPDIRGPDSRGPEMRGLDMRSDNDRSRKWPTGGPNQPWTSLKNPNTNAPAADGSHPRSQSLLGDYQSVNDRMRTQNSSLLRGPNYPPASTPSGMSNMHEYGDMSRSQGPRGLKDQLQPENQFSSQNTSRFAERDYGLSGYDSNRNQYGSVSRSLNSSTHWQHGGGNDIGDGGRGQGLGETWNRRGKPLSNY